MRAPTQNASILGAQSPPRALRHRLIAPLVVLVTFAVILAISPRADATPPELSLRTTVSAGDQVAVAGDGFTPGARVEVRWNDADGQRSTADADGHISALVRVPDDAPLGENTIVAVELDRENDAVRRTSVSVLVVDRLGDADADGPHADGHDGDGAHDGGHPVEDSNFGLKPRPAHGHARTDGQGQAADADAHPEPTEHGHAPTTATAAPTPDIGAGHEGHGASSAPAPEPTDSGGHTAHIPPSTGAHDCGAYPEPRVLLEIHTWWEGDPVPDGHVAHLHAETCFPVGQTVSGVLTLDTRIVMHDNPGHLWRYDSHLHEGIGETVGLDETCGLGNTCEYWVRTRIDTTALPDGCYEYRNKPRVELPNGDVMLTSGGWPVRTENGNTAQSGGFRDPDACWDDGRGITGRGWYDDHGYQNPVFVGPVDDVRAGATVSGTWSPTVRLDAGSDGHEPTFSAAYIDADFHHNDEDTDGGGIVLGTWDDGFRGELRIDTNRLSNGFHKLILRVEAAAGGGRLVALQYVPFIVDN